MRPDIQSLWIGTEISVLERLSMASFMQNGHPYHLYVYREVKGVPDGVILKDANEILEERHIYLNHGSHATFADWFRWTLIYRHGNYWADTDMVCLRPFDFEEDIVFGKEEYDLPNVSVLKFPEGHAFPKFMMENCAAPNRILPYDSLGTRTIKYLRKFALGNRMSIQGWGESGGPKGFRNALKYFGMYDMGKPYTFFYPVHYDHWRYIFDETLKNDTALFSDTYAIHLWNNGMKKVKNFDKNARFSEHSMIEQLKQKYL